ncbi:MAG: hypothetical protein AB7S41_08955 [Parvibaculaceae bacterium]
MTALEDAIRSARQAGRLHGLTLWAKSDGFQANLREAVGWRVETRRDPIEALIAVLAEDAKRFPFTPANQATAKPDVPASAAPAAVQGVFD